MSKSFRSRHVIPMIAFLLAASANAQWIDWSNQYPYQQRRVYAQTMHRTNDGNLLLCGTINGGWTPGSGIPFEDWPLEVYLIKVLPSGDTLWTRHVDVIKPWAITHVVDLIDGNMLIAGTAQSSYEYCGMAVSALPMAQLFAMKVDQAGNVLWWHQYDQPCARSLADAWETANEEIHLLAMNTQQPNIMIGYVPPTWFEDYTLTSAGVTVSIEDQPVGTYYYDNIGCAATTSGRYVFSSLLDTVGQNNLELYLIRFTEDGDQGGMVLLSDTLRKNTRRILTTLDDGLLMLANYDYASSRILHTDTNGTILWDRIYPYKMVDVIALPDTTYLTVGTVGTFQSPDRQQMCVTLLSSAGDSLWSRFYGDSLYDMGSSIVRTLTGFVAYGTKDAYSGSVQPRLFIAPDTIGAVIPLGVEPRDVASMMVFPLPADDRVCIRTARTEDEVNEVMVIDAQGRTIIRTSVPGSTRDHWLDVKGLPAGTYAIVSITPTGRLRSPLVIAR